MNINVYLVIKECNFYVMIYYKRRYILMEYSVFMFLILILYICIYYFVFFVIYYDLFLIWVYFCIIDKYNRYIYR